MKKNRLFNILLVFVLLATTILLSVPAVVRASGAAEVTKYPVLATDDGYWFTNSWQTWANAIRYNPTGIANDNNPEMVVGWYARTTGVHNWNIYAGVVGFYCGDLDPDIDLVSTTLRLKIEDKQNPFGNAFFFSAWEFDMSDRNVGVNDFDDLIEVYGGVRIGSVEDYTAYSVGDWVEIEINQDPDYILTNQDENGYVWFYIATTNHGNENEPVYDTTDHPWIKLYTKDSAYDPELVIEYIENTPEREPVIDTNAPVDTTITGDEVADNITWQTPRTAYADEELYLKVNGDSGATITLELVDQDGVILDEVEDSIRTDGNYDYSTDLPDSWFGFVRLYETTHNIVSDWGYVMPSPDGDEPVNNLFAVSTEYPQYDYLFKRYLTYENDPFVIHFKTNIQDDEHADHDFNIYSNGDSDNTTLIFSESLEWLNDNYYNASANNSFLNAWRYIIMTPNVEGAGFEDYDGLIYDLDYDYTSNHAGFLQAKILDTTDNSTLANSHSCYWYIPNESDGVIFHLNKSTYTKAEPLLIDMQIGGACQITETLYDLAITIIDDSGTTVETHNESFVEGLNEYEYQAPVTSGNYEVRFTFSNDDISWSYIHDEQFTVKGTLTQEGAESIVDNILQWLENTGLNTTTGYWILLLLGMVVLFLLAYKSPIMRVALPLVYLGLFMIWEFVDSWLIILLALGAGVVLYGIFRKKTGGGGSSEG